MLTKQINLHSSLFKYQNVMKPGVVTTQYSQRNRISVSPSSIVGFVGKLYEQYYEPRHEVSNIVECATSKGSDQPAHTYL